MTTADAIRATTQMTIQDWERAWEERFPAGQVFSAADLGNFDCPEPVVARKDDTHYELLVEDANYWYPIPIDECETAMGLADWIAHMSQKTWVTKWHIYQFVNLVLGR